MRIDPTRLRLRRLSAALTILVLGLSGKPAAARTAKPPLHGRHWMAIAELQKMGYTLEVEDRTSGPINAILLDREHGTIWGGSSDHGEDYGIGW